MAFPSYSTGTVSVPANGTVVTGVGTIWSGVNARPGDLLQIGEFLTIVSDVTDVTHLAIPPWGGGAQSAVSYAIWQMSPLRFVGGQAMADVSTMVAALNTSGFYFFVDVSATAPDPSYGEDGQFALQPSTGKEWLKTGGVWVLQGIFKAFGIAAPWSSATAYNVNDVATLAGSSYLCTAPNTNQSPPNAAYWQVLAAKGDTGATGTTGAAGTDGAGYGGTSTTSLLIAAGSQVFATQAGLAYVVGSRVRAASAANGANYMEGLVTAYSGTSLTIDVTRVGGAGTFADWNLSIAGDPGSGDMLSTNNLSDVVNPAAARSNIGSLGAVKVQKFTINGTYTPDPHLLYATIECVGGGGGGGAVNGSSGQLYCGGGGGSGGYSRLIASAAAIGTSQAVTIGTAGNGGAAGANNGGAGGDTSVGTLCIAKGGAGGYYGASAQVGVGGAGGIPGTGDIVAGGAPGGSGTYSQGTVATTSGSGSGGSSYFGGGAPGANGINANGIAASNYGSGGSGAAVNGSSTLTAAGGNGSAGFVIITEYCSQ